MKLPYRYLFISDRGLPLSIRALSNVLDRLFLTIELADLGLLPTLSVHDFSHTFAVSRVGQPPQRPACLGSLEPT